MAGCMNTRVLSPMVAALACFWLNSAEANVTLNFADSQWTKLISNTNHPENKQVVADPKTGQGKVLQVTYYPDTRVGTGFDVDYFKDDPAQVCLTYDVFFPKGFDWVKGGKLPGLYGGTGRCSGGRRENCFSTRMMWSRNSTGMVYLYLTKAAGEKSKAILCKPTGLAGVTSECDGDYGWSYQKGAFTFKTDQWNTVKQRVRMNVVGKTDGELEVSVNDKTVSAKGLTWRTSGDGIKIRGLMFSTFFGGHDQTWAPTKKEKTYFRNISFRKC